MKERTPKYPWCTGVPRPTLVANMDAEEAIISYYTAPVCQPECKTAIIKLKGVVHYESQYINDEQNSHLQSGLMRDVIHVKEGAGANEYVFLFHNEWIKATAAALEEFPGADNLMENLKSHHNSDFDRD